MAANLRQKVLEGFKSLHRTRLSVFRGDGRTLGEARKKINEEYRKNKHVNNEEAIQELINYSKAVENELRTCVIQAEEVEPGKFQAVITDHTVKLDNVPFKMCDSK